MASAWSSRCERTGYPTGTGMGRGVVGSGCGGASRAGAEWYGGCQRVWEPAVPMGGGLAMESPEDPKVQWGGDNGPGRIFKAWAV